MNDFFVAVVARLMAGLDRDWLVSLARFVLFAASLASAPFFGRARLLDPDIIGQLLQQPAKLQRFDCGFLSGDFVQALDLGLDSGFSRLRLGFGLTFIGLVHG